MRDFIRGVTDYWAVAVLRQEPEAYQRVIVSQAYYNGHVAGAATFFVALLGAAAGLGFLGGQWLT